MGAQISELQDAELIHSLLASERQLIAARMQHSMNQLENTSQLAVLRKDIARMHSEARRREIAQGLDKDSLLHTHRRSFSADGAEAAGGDAEKGGFLAGVVDKLTGKD